MIWVADTGPVLHLAEANAVELLPLLGEVVIPPGVEEELLCAHFPVRLPVGVSVRSLTARASADAAAWCDAGVLHRGEAQAIVQARQMTADFLLTDGAAARLLAETCGLRARGSLGVVLWLAGQRRISVAAARVHLDNLARSSLWVSARVLAEARAALERMANA